MEIRDPKAMRALAHPLRIRLLEFVGVSGEATATTCADAVSESPANCSFHLRTLERYGFIERVPGKTGRDRPYRITDISQSWSSDPDDPAASIAGAALDEAFLEWDIERLRTSLRVPLPEKWRGNMFRAGATLWMTPAETRTFGDAIRDLIAPYVERWEDPLDRPADGRPVRIVAVSTLIPDLDVDDRGER